MTRKGDAGEQLEARSITATQFWQWRKEGLDEGLTEGQKQGKKKGGTYERVNPPEVLNKHLITSNYQSDRFRPWSVLVSSS
jgi:flagellar biosynthesis/type III secretory pathway protein FliH